MGKVVLTSFSQNAFREMPRLLNHLYHLKSRPETCLTLNICDDDEIIPSDESQVLDFFGSVFSI